MTHCSLRKAIMEHLCENKYIWIRALYIKSKKVYFTEGQTTLTAPTVIWNIGESMFDFHHTGLFEERHSAGPAQLSPCAPVSPPPQRTTMPHGVMLNQYVDSCLTCIWTHGLCWEYCQMCNFFIFILFFFLKACLQRWTFMLSVSLWPTCQALQHIDSQSCWGLHTRRWHHVKYLRHDRSRAHE